MKKVRIVERTELYGYVHYFIQKKHYLFRWIWVDAHIIGANSFSTLEEAKKHLCYFDGTKVKERVVG